MKKVAIKRADCEVTIHGYRESAYMLYPSSAQVQVTKYEEGEDDDDDDDDDDEEDIFYFDLFSISEVDNLIKVLKEIRETFPQ